MVPLTFTGKDDLFKAIFEAANEGRRARLGELVELGLTNGLESFELADFLVLQALRICDTFNRSEIYFNEFYLSIDSIDKVLQMLRPDLAFTTSSQLTKSTVVLGTIQGDVHEMGKTVLRILLEKEGIQVVDLGANVKPEAFIKAIQKHGARVLGVSCLLSPAMIGMIQLKKRMQKANLEYIWTIIGGKATSRNFAVNVGFSEWASTAVQGAKLIISYLGVKG